MMTKNDIHMETKLKNMQNNDCIACHIVNIDGTSLEFCERFIDDFGLVINPSYEIVPGYTGGLRSGDKWLVWQNEIKRLPKIKYQSNGLPEGWAVIKNPNFKGYKAGLYAFFNNKTMDAVINDPDLSDPAGTGNSCSHRYNVIDSGSQFVAGHATPEAAIRFAKNKIGYTNDTFYIYEQQARWVEVRKLTKTEKVAYDYVAANIYFG